MKLVGLAGSGERLSVLCIGAHSDDIEIGAGATILGWIDRGVRLDVHWAVLSAYGPRADEARASAEAFLADAARSVIELAEFKDGFFPYQGADIKTWFEALKRRIVARCDPVPLAQRCASGSSRGVDVDVEHVSRPRHPRIRDSEMGRRSGPAERLHPGQQDADGAQGKAALRPFRHATLKGLVRRADLHGSGAAAGRGMPRAGRDSRKLSTDGRSWCSEQGERPCV